MVSYKLGMDKKGELFVVLILVVVEDGLVRTAVTEFLKVRGQVLILVVVEDGLVLLR